MKNSVNDTIIRKINSQLSQVVMVPRDFEYVFTDRTILLHLVGKVPSEVSYIRHGHEYEIPISTLGTSHMLHDVQNIFEVPILSRKAWHTELSSSHQLCSARRS